MNRERMCEDCGAVLGRVDSCTFPRVLIDGTTYPRAGVYDPGKPFSRSVTVTDADTRCDDCGIVTGKVHHYGCENEPCPVCNEPFPTCEHEAERVK